MLPAGEIVVAGHICVDITPTLAGEVSVVPGDLSEVGPVAMTLGGCVGNTGGDLADLGAPVRLVATIADDELGAVVRTIFENRGLSSDGLAVVADAGTSYSIVLQPRGADRTIWHHAGANALFDDGAVDLDGAAMLHVGYPPLLRGLLVGEGLPLRRLFDRAVAAGVTTSLDMAVVDTKSEVGALDWSAILANVLPLVDVFSPSADDLRSALGLAEGFSTGLVERLAEEFIHAGVAIVAISAGAEGLYLRTGSAERIASGGQVLAGLSSGWANQRFWMRPAPLADTVTTNGAGDAATAGLLYGLWLGLDPAETGRLAIACAATLISGRATTRDAIAMVDQDLAARVSEYAIP
ncbi:MAG: hypothetical protein QOH55_997 [Microbacteriaceae bacterium]|nr:hypothetical protein [Microbacteriaceae bacterium]